MDDVELKRLEALCEECETSKRSTVFPTVDDPFRAEVNAVVPAALAEIRRLCDQLVATQAESAIRASLIKDAEWDARVGYDGDPGCPWCEGFEPGPHWADCPAFSTDGKVR